MQTTHNDAVRQAVRARYGSIAETRSSKAGCGTPTSCCETAMPSTLDEKAYAMGYSTEETAAVPEGANLALGCGNPTAIAALQAGEIVLDLGSGAGFDCFLAARAVGDTGHVIGVDMTPEIEFIRNNHAMMETRYILNVSTQ